MFDQNFDFYANPNAMTASLLPEMLRRNAYSLVPNLASSANSFQTGKSNPGAPDPVMRTANSELDSYAAFKRMTEKETAIIPATRLQEVKPSQFGHGVNIRENQSMLGADAEKSGVMPMGRDIYESSSSQPHNNQHTLKHIESCPDCKAAFNSSIGEAVKSALVEVLDFAPEFFDNVRGGNNHHGSKIPYDAYYRRWKNHNRSFEDDRAGRWDVLTILTTVLIVVLIMDLFVHRR